MLDFILIGLLIGLVVYMALFLVSLMTLGAVSGCIRLAVVFYRNLFFESSLADHQKPSPRSERSRPGLRHLTLSTD